MDETHRKEMGKVRETFEMLWRPIAGMHLAKETSGTNLIRDPSEQGLTLDRARKPKLKTTRQNSVQDSNVLR